MFGIDSNSEAAPDSLIDYMVGLKDNWKIVAIFISNVLRQKELDEREYQKKRKTQSTRKTPGKAIKAYKSNSVIIFQDISVADHSEKKGGCIEVGGNTYFSQAGVMRIRIASPPARPLGAYSWPDCLLQNPIGSRGGILEKKPPGDTHLVCRDGGPWEFSGLSYLSSTRLGGAQNGALMRCNSLPSEGEKRKAGTQRNDNPYKKKESPEAFMLQEAIRLNKQQTIEMERLLQDIPDVARKKLVGTHIKSPHRHIYPDRGKPIDIKRMAGDTTPEEIGEIRPLENDTFAVTITSPGHLPDKIRNLSHIRIGLVRCLIERRVKVDRCPRCWAYDHGKSTCQGPDRSGNCYRCGRPDHNAMDCKEQEYCPICNEDHKMGTLKCKAFKIALKVARQKPRRKNQTINREKIDHTIEGPTRGLTEINDPRDPLGILGEGKADRDAISILHELLKTPVRQVKEDHDIDNLDDQATEVEEDPSPFALTEIKIAAQKLKNQKAPGPDGISAEIVKAAVALLPDIFLLCLNTLLKRNSFPQSWKTANIVLIPKEIIGSKKS
ncbi:hypothetical protein JTB14_038427 [Gonioctena quinquepunctata]|nr:hypothetical protein JTB14_038427 [Gonioctena quinquepunctata]